MTAADPETADVAVIGAGPAGLAASLRAAEAGLRVVLLDEQPTAGGAVWRSLPAGGAPEPESPGPAMLAALAASPVRHLAGATVWDVTRDRRIGYSRAGRARRLSARRLIVATGALERPAPFPGWTLPGVLTAGAAQILIETAGAAPPGPLVMAGSGPLLLMAAAQLARAGEPPVAVVETTPPGALVRALPRLRPGPAAWRAALDLLAWRRALRRAGVPLHRAATALEAVGEGRVTALRFTVGGRKREIPCASLAIHAGLAPNVQITRALGLAHDWNPTRRVWEPRLDALGRSGIEGISVAGDGAGVAGWEAARASGLLAALGALQGLAPVAETEIAEARAALARATTLRPFLDRAWPPDAAFLDPADAVTLCRCESVSAGAIRKLVAAGERDPDAIKALSRAGMGPCQGRFCGLGVSEVTARALDLSPEAVGHFRLRPPLKPLALGELAALQPAEPVDVAG